MKLGVNKSYFCAALLAVGLSYISHAAFAANSMMDRLDKENRVNKKLWPGRLGDQRELRCKACEERERETRFDYLSRAIASKGSAEYQNTVTSLILADEKFVKQCWARLSKREIEIFFTINEQGKAEDFAWFPNKTYGKCLSKHVTKIDFPKPEKAHYSWMVASELVVME